MPRIFALWTATAIVLSLAGLPASARDGAGEALVPSVKVSGKSVKAQWYDPREGTWLSIGNFASTGVREFTAPSRGVKEDWLLVLDANGPDAPRERSGRGGPAAIKGPLRQSSNPN
jgi:hypothetical protein